MIPLFIQFKKKFMNTANFVFFFFFQYEAEALENTASAEILRVGVEDKDKKGSEGWKAKYFFISGNEDNTYNITTDAETNEGIIGIAKVTISLDPTENVNL